MVKKINHIQKFVGGTTWDTLDPKWEIRSGVAQEITTSFKGEKFNSHSSEELLFSDLQNKILSKPYMQTHHKKRLQDKTSELIQQKNMVGLQQLYKNIDFTEKGWLIFNTPKWSIKFAPKQASFDEVKDIEGIDSTCLSLKHPITKQEWLWLNWRAINKLIDANKRVCTADLFNLAKSSLPLKKLWVWDHITQHDEDFLDLLWATQYGFHDEHWSWNKAGRCFWIPRSLFHESDVKMMAFGSANDIQEWWNDMWCGYGVWFIEN